MELGVHDLVSKDPNKSTEEVYKETADFVQAIEQLNYKRYWFAEHHNAPNYASVSPELHVAHMAALTSRIRLGTGGTMIMHYSPLKIAENMKTLSGMAPGRIDIGIGRAPGSGPNEVMALAQGKPEGFDDLYDKMDVILDYLQDYKAPGIYGKTQAMPAVAHLPEPWLLGSSGQSAIQAAERGLGYSFAKFFGVETDLRVFTQYRQHFGPSRFFQNPKVMVSYQIVIADSQEEADYLAKPIELGHLAQAQGKLLDTTNPEDLKDVQMDAAGTNFIQEMYDNHYMIKGTPETVETVLAQEIETLGIDELIVYAPLYDTQARIASYRHLAKMFNKI